MKKLFNNISKMDTRNIIAIAVVINLFAVLYILLFMKVPEQNMQLVSMTIDSIIKLGFGAIIGYMFASSKNNQLPNPPAE